MEKIALLNASPGFEPNAKVLNLLIENNKLKGMGYLPDDDQSLQINLPKSKFIENITELNKNLNKKEYHKVGSSTVIETIQPKIESQTLQNIELPEILDSAVTNQEPLLTTCSGSELLYLIQEAKKIGAALHVIIQKFEIDYPIIQCYKKELPLTNSLPIPLLYSKYAGVVLEALEHQTIDTLCSGDSEASSLIGACLNLEKKGVSIEKTLPLITKNPRKIFNLKTEKLAINTKPNLTFLDTKEGHLTEVVLLCMSEGEILYNTL